MTATPEPPPGASADERLDKPEERLFGEALAQPAERRAAYVQRAARGDRALAGRVLDLLAAHATAGAFLETPAVRPRAAAHEAPVREGPGTVIGPYELIEELGEGGFGVVYRARQTHPVRREVALKVIKLGMDTRQVIARFEAERQALAVLDHPNIARVLDAGATAAGRPYFVMELVEGEDITRYCDRQRLGTIERIELFRDVCDALHHAHQRGLIHRDLKPSNILVAGRDGRHVPKVIDFGIAKATKQRLTDQSLHTEVGQFIGTPVYMSPEQAERGESDVDTRSDIYSLGVVLYELLAGSPPFEADELTGRALAEIQSFICEHEPLPPSGRVTRLAPDASTVAAARDASATELVSQLRGDLDWIVMKALEKERERRYDTASAFSEDLGRFLQHLPVLASPPSRTYRARKFVRRHRVLVGAGAVVLTAVLSGVALMLLGFVRARDEARESAAQRDLLEEVLLANNAARGNRLSLAEGDALEAQIAARFGEDSPLYVGVVRLRAERLDTEGRFEAASIAYDRALDLTARIYGEDAPQRVELLSQLGAMYVRSADLPAARRELEQALALEEAVFAGPSYLLNDARRTLAGVATSENHHESALALLDEAARLQATQAPDDLVARYACELSLLQAAAALQRNDVVARVFEELLMLTDRIYPGNTAARADLRVNLATWNRSNEIAPTALVERHLREALEIYTRLPQPAPLKTASAHSLLAELLLGRAQGGDVEEGLDLADAALAGAREVYGNDSPTVLDALERHARTLERHGRRAGAIAALLEVVALRRRLDGPAADVTQPKESLERLAQSVATDPTVPQGHADLTQAWYAARLLERENENPAFQGYRRLGNAIRLRRGDPTPALSAIGGMFGNRRPARGELHPYDLAVGAIAQHFYGRRLEAQKLLEQAEAIAARPEFANDRVTQDMVLFARRRLGAPDPGPDIDTDAAPPSPAPAVSPAAVGGAGGAAGADADGRAATAFLRAIFGV